MPLGRGLEGEPTDEIVRKKSKFRPAPGPPELDVLERAGAEGIAGIVGEDVDAVRLLSRSLRLGVVCAAFPIPPDIKAPYNGLLASLGSGGNGCKADVPAAKISLGRGTGCDDDIGSAKSPKSPNVLGTEESYANNIEPSCEAEVAVAGVGSESSLLVLLTKIVSPADVGVTMEPGEDTELPSASAWRTARLLRVASMERFEGRTTGVIDRFGGGTRAGMADKVAGWLVKVAIRTGMARRLGFGVTELILLASAGFGVW